MMKTLLVIPVLLICSVNTFGQNTNQKLLKQSLELFCKEEIILNCLDLDDKLNDTIYFIGNSLEPTKVKKLSKRLFYQVSDDLTDNEAGNSCIISINEMFNASGILMLSFKILKTPRTKYLNRTGQVRCQIVDNKRISFVDPKFK